MEIILREDVQHLGKAGEVVKVRDGYARNYLLPHGLAYPATDGNKKRIVFEAERVAKQRAGERSAAEVAAQALANVELIFKMKVGEEDKLFGSVTSADIAHQLQAQGFQIEKRQIDLHEPIKSLGVFKIPVRLHAEVKPEIKVWVIKQ